jgi:enoyl-CoA hydratase
MPNTIEIIHEDGWRRLVLNRPHKRNAMSHELLTELRDAVVAADADESVKAILLSANGQDFCAGFDIGGDAVKGELSEVSTDVDLTKNLAGPIEGVRLPLKSLWTCRKPIVALVHGRCLAGGTELAGFCDMVIATEDAQFGFPPVRDMGTAAIPMWLYYAGPQWARRLMYTGDSISGSDAAKIGLVLKALPAAEAEAEAVGLVKRLSKIDWQMLAASKRIQNSALELMGMHSHHHIAGLVDNLSTTTPIARELAAASPDEYVAILKARRENVFGPGIVNVSGPDPFDEDGRLLAH